MSDVNVSSWRGSVVSVDRFMEESTVEVGFLLVRDFVEAGSAAGDIDSRLRGEEDVVGDFRFFVLAFVFDRGCRCSFAGSVGF